MNRDSMQWVDRLDQIFSGQNPDGSRTVVPLHEQGMWMALDEAIHNGITSEKAVIDKVKFLVAHMGPFRKLNDQLITDYVRNPRLAGGRIDPVLHDALELAIHSEVMPDEDFFIAHANEIATRPGFIAANNFELKGRIMGAGGGPYTVRPPTRGENLAEWTRNATNSFYHSQTQVIREQVGEIGRLYRGEAPPPLSEFDVQQPENGTPGLLKKVGAAAEPMRAWADKLVADSPALGRGAKAVGVVLKYGKPIGAIAVDGFNKCFFVATAGITAYQVYEVGDSAYHGDTGMAWAHAADLGVTGMVLTLGTVNPILGGVALFGAPNFSTELATVRREDGVPQYAPQVVADLISANSGDLHNDYLNWIVKLKKMQADGKLDGSTKVDEVLMRRSDGQRSIVNVTPTPPPSMLNTMLSSLTSASLSGMSPSSGTQNFPTGQLVHTTINDVILDEARRYLGNGGTLDNTWLLTQMRQFGNSVDGNTLARLEQLSHQGNTNWIQMLDGLKFNDDDGQPVKKDGHIDFGELLAAFQKLAIPVPHQHPVLTGDDVAAALAPFVHRGDSGRSQ